MLNGEKILITGVTGKISFPIARELARHNEVWGVARMRNPLDQEKLVNAGIKPVAMDVSLGDFSSLPTDFTYIFHAAVDPGITDWQACVHTNAYCSGELLNHCRPTKGFVYCSTGSTYAYQGQRPLTEQDPPGIPMPLLSNYSFSKVAGETLCNWIARKHSIPLAIIRICSTYGPEGGAPNDRMKAILNRQPIRIHPDQPNNYNPIYEDDYVDLGIRALAAASTPPIVVNWTSSETVSVEDYCNYIGELIGIEPIFELSPDAHTPLWPDTTLMHDVLGTTKVHWRDGMRNTLKAIYPELKLTDED